MNEAKEQKETKFAPDPFEIGFPLPEHLDPSKCRDEFLSTIIEEHERRVSPLRRSTARDSSVIENPLEDEYRESVKGAEAMVVRQMARLRQKETTRRTVQQVMESIKLRSNMMSELYRQCQKAAIEFVSVRLLKQLRLFSGPWPGEQEGIPYNLFSWSLDDFLMRLEMKQLYLDVINRERSAEDLDCVKFCRDLSEIELLIYEIREDYSQDRDLCENSIELLRSAAYNMNAPWVKKLNENLKDIQDNKLTALLLARSSSFRMVFRQTTVMGDFENASALDPIEMRYQINWIRSCADQRLMLINGREEAMREELRKLEEQAKQDESVQYSSELMYSLELGKLRESITTWNDRLDNDLENADVLCTVSRLAVQKLKDDLKFYTEEKDTYLRRLEEVRALMAQEAITRGVSFYRSFSNNSDY
nr:uncharacterized protein LOC108069878 [Drosophila takahashii]